MVRLIWADGSDPPPHGRFTVLKTVSNLAAQLLFLHCFLPLLLSNLQLFLQLLNRLLLIFLIVLQSRKY